MQFAGAGLPGIHDEADDIVDETSVLDEGGTPLGRRQREVAQASATPTFLVAEAVNGVNRDPDDRTETHAPTCGIESQ